MVAALILRIVTRLSGWVPNEIRSLLSFVLLQVLTICHDIGTVALSTFDSTKTSTTVISFLVKVPVLSEQITVMAPSVSTDGIVLMIACSSDISLTPSIKSWSARLANPQESSLPLRRYLMRTRDQDQSRR